jgi:glucose 1-dehydrogenase
MIDLTGKIALVTGAGRGIGKGCALALAKAGATLILNDRPGGGDLPETLEEVRKLGATAHGIEADLFAKGGIDGLVSGAVQAAGRVDILVSNPAFSRRGDFLDYSEDELERTLNGTFKSGFLLGQRVARLMVARGGGGKIVFISSVQARMPFARCAPYGAAKAALNQLARTMAVELCQHRINVNAIEPGWIDTPGERVTFSAETLAAEAARMAWGRLGTPEDIGNAAAFLVSPLADYITGVILPVDGLIRFQHLRAREVPVEQAATGADPRP